MSSLNRVHLGWWKLGPRVKEDLRYGVPSKQAQDMGSAYDRRSGNFLIFFLNRVPDFSHGYMTKDQVSDQTSLSDFETTHFTLN